MVLKLLPYHNRLIQPSIAICCRQSPKTGHTVPAFQMDCFDHHPQRQITLMKNQLLFDHTGSLTQNRLRWDRLYFLTRKYYLSIPNNQKGTDWK